MSIFVFRWRPSKFADYPSPDLFSSYFFPTTIHTISQISFFISSPPGKNALPNKIVHNDSDTNLHELTNFVNFYNVATNHSTPIEIKLSDSFTSTNALLYWSRNFPVNTASGAILLLVHVFCLWSQHNLSIPWPISTDHHWIIHTRFSGKLHCYE